MAHPRITLTLATSFLMLLGSLPATAQGLAAPTQLSAGNNGESIDRGWEGLARVLRAMSPSVDTSIPPTASDITNRIEGLLKSGRFEQALSEINQRLAVESNRSTPGVDVQLLFLQAYAQAALGRIAEAESIYRQMTIRFPELAEPWNNLAAIYVQRGDLEQARSALEMAIMINPGYKAALSNLGDVQLMIAMKAYQRAAEGAGAPADLALKIQAVRQILDGKIESVVAKPASGRPGQTNRSNSNNAASR